MVKLGRGPRRQSGLGRQEPVPLFPPGDLPVFGPPPVNMRRPMPPPRGLPPNFAPPPPPISRAHLPPPPPPPHMRSLPLHPLPPPRYPRRPGPPPPPPLRPLLQTPVLPPRPLAFMRGGRAPIHMGRPGPHMKRLGKSMKKNRSKKNKSKDFNKGDGEHYCEACDRGWDTLEELQDHLESHMTCGLEGCTFTAHPKIVDVHVKLQHRSGIFKQINCFKSQEDIEKWREERRRKYPTKENIEKKQAEKTEMEMRGERLEIKNSFNKKLFQGKNRTTKKRNNETKFKFEPELKKFRVAEKTDLRKLLAKPTSDSGSECVITVTEDESGNDSPSNRNFSDEEWAVDNSHKTDSYNKPFTSGLSILMNTYAGNISDEDPDNAENKEENRSVKDSCAESNNTLIGDPANDAPEEVGSKADLSGGLKESEIMEPKENFSNSSHVMSKDNSVKNKKYNLQKGNQRTKTNIPKTNKIIPQKKLTLLERLLTTEIRRERNYILQCARYVFEKNFFLNSSTEKKS